MKTAAIILILLISLVGCEAPNPDERKIIDTGGFEIEVPVTWKYKKERGIDSFVGRIKSNRVNLSFDWSEMGYASHLIPSEQEFIYEKENEWMPINLPYAKKGVTYTSGNVSGERERIMRETGIKDTSLVLVEPFQTPEKEIQFQDEQYKAILTYRDTVIQIEIEIPEEVKKHEVIIDTIDNYRRKLIWPKKGETGMTGVYLEDLNSPFNFNLVGIDLSLEDQERAINSFRTIKIKRNIN